ncbi:MAG: cell division protein ZapB [Deltaproteobacteria bacterium]|nr:cell division protein ZapB [Deltaproteobacteria bacterium]
MVENEMLLMRQFEEIEQKVERLIAICSSLEVKNIQLRNTISGLETELRLKTEALENLSEERTMIRSKIDTLLVKLENIAEMDSNSSR